MDTKKFSHGEIIMLLRLFVRSSLKQAKSTSLFDSDQIEKYLLFDEIQFQVGECDPYSTLNLNA